MQQTGRGPDAPAVTLGPARGSSFSRSSSFVTFSTDTPVLYRFELVCWKFHFPRRDEMIHSQTSFLSSIISLWTFYSCSTVPMPCPLVRAPTPLYKSCNDCWNVSVNVIHLTQTLFGLLWYNVSLQILKHLNWKENLKKRAGDVFSQKENVVSAQHSLKHSLIL